MTEEDQSVLAISLPQADNILSFARSQFKGEVPPAGVPPHITLLYPWMPPSQIDAKVLAELALLFAGFSTFGFSLKLGWFGREVLLLVPGNPAPFIRLTKAIIRQWPEFPYYDGAYNDIKPHVSLAYGNESSLSELATQITDQVPVHSRASSVTLSVGRPGHMITRAEFPLSTAG